MDQESNLTNANLPFVSSRRNPLVRRFKELSTSKGRLKYSMLLLEGTHLLEEAIESRAIPCEIIATSQWLKDHPKIIQRIPKGVLLSEVTPLVLEAATTTVSPDGVASLVNIAQLPTLKKKPLFVLALDRLQDPGNLGTLFRTALAAEIEVVWLGLGADPLGQKALRSSAGSILKLPFDRFKTELNAIDELAKRLKLSVDNGFQVVATYAPKAFTPLPVMPYWELDWSLPTVLVLGNEGAGLHPALEQCCTHGVTLPHSNYVESLNVASAAVPLLLERQRAKMILNKKKL